jgi:hypothetical protein
MEVLQQPVAALCGAARPTVVCYVTNVLITVMFNDECCMAEQDSCSFRL